jgi:hypothetical protein
VKATLNWRIGIFSSFICLAAFVFSAGINNTNSPLAEFESKSKATPKTVANTGQLANISTRMRVLSGDDVLIAGFIITGTDPKNVLIRGIGPSLSKFGVAGALVDPTLELHQGSKTFAQNDDWKTNSDGTSQQGEIEATTIPPTNDSESAILAILSPGAYTAILAGKTGGTGVGLVEVYDLAQGANSTLANISTRGLVDTGDDAMIGGIIVGGSGGSANVLIRAIGPSLQSAGISNALQNPTLGLHDGNGVLVADNDDWRDFQSSLIAATGIPPASNQEAAILAGLAPGSYTVVVRGKNDTTGVALVEAYKVNLPSASYLLPARGIYAQFDRRGVASGYWSGQLIQTFNDFDSVVGSTVAQEASLQLDKMRAMGVNTITFELRTSDPTYDPGPFVPPVCNIPPVLGFQWPQPTATELTNLVAFFDLVQSKGMHVFLRLVNTHMEEQPPTNSGTWLGAILASIKDHPALDLVLFEGDKHVLHFNGQPDTCGIPAEPPLWLGATAYAGQYVNWAMNFARATGMPWRKLSAEAILGSYFSDSGAPAGPEATDEHQWSPIVVLKAIFDDLAIPNNERTYAVSFYSHRKCLGAGNVPCTEADPHSWADETLQRAFTTIGTGNGARVVAPEMGLGQAPTSTWTSGRALESLLALMEKYGVEGGTYWRWVSFETQEDSNPTLAEPVKRRGDSFTYNPVQKEILDIGGLHPAILNGSLEIGGAVPYSWTIKGNGAGTRHFLAGEGGQPEVPSRGQYDLQLVTGPGMTDIISGTSDPIAVMSNVTYTTTANLRFSWTGDPNPSAAPTLRPQVFLTLHYSNSQGSPSSIRPTDVFRFFQEDSTNGFATFPVQYTPPDDAASVGIEVGAARNGLPTAITLDADNFR